MCTTRGTSRKDKQTKLKIGNENICDGQSILEELNSFFSSIGFIQGSQPHLDPNAVPLRPSPVASLALPAITEQGVEKVIIELAPK